MVRQVDVGMSSRSEDEAGRKVQRRRTGASAVVRHGERSPLPQPTGPTTKPASASAPTTPRQGAAGRPLRATKSARERSVNAADPRCRGRVRLLNGVRTLRADMPAPCQAQPCAREGWRCRRLRTPCMRPRELAPGHRGEASGPFERPVRTVICSRDSRACSWAVKTRTLPWRAPGGNRKGDDGVQTPERRSLVSKGT